MPPELRPALIPPEQIRRDLAVIFATALRRLRDRQALPSSSPENLDKTLPNSLEAVPANPLTDHVG